MKCWHCGSDLIWGGDCDLNEEDYEEFSMATNLSCSKCGSHVDVYLPRRKENEMEESVKNAWLVEIYSPQDEEWDLVRAYPSTKLVTINSAMMHPDQQEDINEARACLFYTQLSKRDTFAEYRWRFGYFNGYSHEMPQKEWTYRIIYDPITKTKEEDQNET
tara:strand:- start:146 stop:628 length:483 start_codon:yes stop_codon:yes gene_type:complete